MANLKILTTDDLRRMRKAEGLIIQGCVGDLNEWIDGINDILTKEGILLEDTKFTDVSAFKNGELTNLLFRFTEDIKLNMGKLAMWRIGTHGSFSGTWLSDYVDNYLGGFEMSDFEQQLRKLNNFADTESSFDFQCDATDGYPVCLTWNRSEGKAWLTPNESLGYEQSQFDEAMRACEKFGIRDCESVEDFNAILDSLGEDAASCKIYDETEDVDLC